MNKIYKILILPVFLTLCIGSMAWAANNLENIAVSRDGDSVVVLITTTEPAKYNSFVTKEKPERVVIDLDGVSNQLPTKEFRDHICNTFSAIRTSQFQVDPILIARIVIDIGRPITFTHHGSDNQIIIKLPAIESESEFTSWSASDYNVSTSTNIPEIDEPELTTSESDQTVPETEPETVATTQTQAVETGSSQAKSVPEAVIQQSEDENQFEEEVEESTAVEAEDEAVEEEEDFPPATEPIVEPPPGMKIEPYPTRSLVTYSVGNVRDPFLPLVRAGNKQAGENLPVLENLKLVGILEDSRGNKALLEDAEGDGYILAPNDRVQNGYLVTVTDNKAIFQITEYGWTRTVALELELAEIH